MRPFLERLLQLEDTRKTGQIGLVFELEVPFQSVVRETRSVARDDSPLDDGDEINDDDGLTPTQHRRKHTAASAAAAKAPRFTSSQRQRAQGKRDRQAKAMNKSHFRLIRKMNVCEAASCKNSATNICIDTGVTGKFNGYAPGHVPITDSLLQQWNEAINDGKETVEDVPISSLDMDGGSGRSPRSRTVIEWIWGSRRAFGTVL